MNKCPTQVLDIEKNTTKEIRSKLNICGRANISRKSLFSYVFTDLNSVENSASLPERL